MVVSLEQRWGVRLICGEEFRDLQQRVADFGYPRAPVPLANAAISLLRPSHDDKLLCFSYGQMEWDGEEEQGRCGSSVLKGRGWECCEGWGGDL